MKRTLALMLGLIVAVAPAQAEPDDETTQRILALESLGRARPTEAAAELEKLRPGTAEFSPQRLELLTVRGLMLAVASQPEAAEHSAAELEAWSGRPGAALAAQAAAATLLVRARSTARGGNLRQADTMLQQALSHLPATLSPRDRWRFVAAHGYIRNEAGKLEEAVRLNHEALALADRNPEL